MVSWGLEAFTTGGGGPGAGARERVKAGRAENAWAGRVMPGPHCMGTETEPRSQGSACPQEGSLQLYVSSTARIQHLSPIDTGVFLL